MRQDGLWQGNLLGRGWACKGELCVWGGGGGGVSERHIAFPGPHFLLFSLDSYYELDHTSVSGRTDPTEAECSVRRLRQSWLDSQLGPPPSSPSSGIVRSEQAGVSEPCPPPARAPARARARTHAHARIAMIRLSVASWVDRQAGETGGSARDERTG
ncbi:hypothetical protein T492DRAFT_258155 [Pavlovales sp. CCMP2436]|nr:hypothetical protein T492DRAFT_258155 [Pavlovales sp. CCMP2436]